MRKRVVLKDVAEAMGVHVSTVSRALDSKYRHLINAKVAEEIIKKSKELGYKQNAAAYSLKTNKTHSVGVVIPDITNSIFPPIIRGIEDALSEAGYLAIMGNTDGSHKREQILIETFLARGIDGLVVASVERNDAHVQSVLDEGIPIVSVNRRVNNELVGSVVPDDREGIRRALTHLVSLGHRKIAHIAGPQHLSTGKDRLDMFRKFQSELGLEGDKVLFAVAESYSESEGERCVEELIVAGGNFTAIACANDQLAVGAIAALQRRKLRCPEDVSVTGYNDMQMVDRITPPLTTIRVAQYEMGFQAGSMLLNMIRENSPAQHIIEPVKLVIRESTTQAL